ncbi:MAG: hypothetical protein J7K72_00070 [Candidatus Aenigmarchaeota archaeon]|nr:hypothetical protein [Candidatus Aenigmarchaeota archaeon]
MIKEIEEADTVYIVDLNMLEVVEKLPQRVIFIDQHIQKRIIKPNIKQVNPIISGKRVSLSYVGCFASLLNVELYLSTLGQWEI